ncbi:PR-1-like protein [Pyrenochaeta sp. DS3sAY3a]|nr:PR-1-like protein [Pyrenochaeta sp. DS3sAY3a]
MLLPSPSTSLLPLLPLLLFPLALAQQPSNSSSSNATSAEYTSDTSFRDAVLDVTNTYRKQHNATGLQWNETLAGFAEEWAGECGFVHSGGPYGENLAAGYPNASASIIAWGQERELYNFQGGEFSPETGHFTQLVWKTTSQVGCARTECNGGQAGGRGDAPGWFVVCEYAPAGNVIGTFRDNVQDQVPADQQPEGPSDPQVPTGGAVGGLRIGGLVWVGLGVGVAVVVGGM